MTEHDTLVDLIYASVEDDSRWIAFLELFAKMLSAKGAFFWITRLDRPHANFWASIGLSEELLKIMRSPDYRDPWLSRADMNAIGIGAIIRSDEICPDEVLVDDPWYRKVCLPNDFHYGGGVLLASSTTLSAAISCNRPRAAGPLTDVELAAWRKLIPHLIRAVGLINGQSRLRREREALIHYFNDFGRSMILVTADADIVAANIHAEQ